MSIPRPSALAALVCCLLTASVLCSRAASALQLGMDDERLNYTSAGTVAGGAWQLHYDTTECLDVVDGVRAPGMTAPGESWITATTNTAMTIDFMWALEGPAQNTLTFSVDGVVKASCEATPTLRWAFASVTIPPGAHTIRWTYRQAGAVGSRVLLDRVGRSTDANASLTSAPWITAALGEPVDHQFTTRRPSSGWLPYQGSLPAGLSHDGMGRITGVPTESGLFYHSFSIYAVTSVVYYTIGIEIADAPTLHGALDSRVLTFTTTASDGTTVWQPVRDGGHHTGDSLVAGLPPPVQRSAPYRPGWSSVHTSLTGPDCISYWVRVGGGRVTLHLDDKQYRSHAPLLTLSGWQRSWLEVPAGVHTVTWKFEPFPGRTATAWLDDVRLRSEGKAFISHQPEIAALPSGEFNFTVPYANPASGWSASSLPPGLALDTVSGTISGTPQRRSVWPLKLYLDGPAGDRDHVQAVINASIPAIQATDLPNSWWRTDTNNGAGWFGQNEITHDGSDAMRSPAIIPGAISSLTTSIQGPGILKWWWHIPAGTAGDTCTVALDGARIPAAIIAGTTAWKQETLPVPAGIHEVSWRWQPDDQGDPATAAAILDEVSFVP